MVMMRFWLDISVVYCVRDLKVRAISHPGDSRGREETWGFDYFHVLHLN